MSQPAVERKPYTPKMVQLSKFGAATLEDVKRNFPMSYSVWKQGEKVCIFNSAPHTVQRLKEKYPEAAVETVPSDNATFLAALKGQSQLNFNIFKALNPECKKVGVSVRSAPQESFQTETAIAYAKAILSGLNDAQDVHFLVRGWLFDAFTALKQEKNDSFTVEKLRSKMMSNKDKAIVTRAIISLESVPAFMKALAAVERAPVCVFFNPDTPRAAKKPRQFHDDKPRGEKTFTERRERKPRVEGERKPREERERKPRVEGERKPRVEGDRKPREERERRPRVERERKPLEERKPAAVFMLKLEGFPENTNEQLIKTLTAKKEAGELKAMKLKLAQQINVLLVTEIADIEATKVLLDRIKINSKQVPYDIRQ